MKKNIVLNHFILIIILLLGVQGYGQDSYNWVGSNGADWTVATNWSPVRTTPSASDTLYFNNGGTYTVTNVPTETIARLFVTNNTNVSLITTGDQTLSINGAGHITNLTIEAGSVLQLSSSSTNAIHINFYSTYYQDVDISGYLIINPNDALTNSIDLYSRYPHTIVSSTGKIINNGGDITSSSAYITFQSNAEYRHNRDGGRIMSATWDANSLVNVIGITNTRPIGINQTFGRFIWNCTSQAANIIFADGNPTFNGALTFQSTGTDTLVFGNSYRIITANNDFIINGGTIVFNNTSNYYTRLYIAGNFTQTGGSLTRGHSTGIQYIYFQSAGVPKAYTKTGGTYNGDGIRVYANANTILNINSDFNIGTSRYFYVQNTAQVYLNANFTGSGYFRNNNGGNVYLNTDISTTCEIQNYGNFYFYDKEITGNANFSIYSYSYNYTTHTEGFSATGENTGNIQVTGTRIYNTSANLIYNGSSPQVTGSGISGAYDLTIDNSAGVTLSHEITVRRTLHLVDGLFELDDYDLILYNSDNTAAYDGSPSTSNMVVTNGTGRLRKYFSSNSTVEFVFPIGDNVGNVEYTPVRLTFVTNYGGYVGVNLTDAPHPDITSYSDYLSRYFTFTTTISSYNYHLNYDFVDPDDVNGNLSNMLAVENVYGTWRAFPSNITAGGNVEITTSPLNSINCPLNGVFSAASQEIICEPNNGILYETFPTASLPSSWSRGVLQGSANWIIRNSPGLSSASGGYYAVFDDYSLGSGVTPNEAWIRTKEVNFCGLSSVYLSYYEYWHGVENTYGYVEISKDGGASWDTVNTNSNVTVGSLSAPVKTVIDLTPYLTGYTSVIIRFSYKEVNAVGRYWYIDDINIFGGNDVGVQDLVSPPLLSCGQSYSNSEQVTMRVYNYSFVDVSNIDWTCDISGGYTGSYSGTIASIPANSYVDVNVATIDMSADDVYHFVMNAEPQAPAVDANPYNNELREGRRQLVQTYPYTENFNTSRAGWHQGGPDPQPPNTAIESNHGREFKYGELPYLGGPDGEGNSWYVKTTRNGAYDYIWLESPVFDFTNVNNPILSFDIKYQLHHYYTQFRVEYSIDDGNTWIQIGNSSDPDWYEGNTNWWYDNFDSPVDTWTHVEHQLCRLSGESCVKFRIAGYAYYGINGSYDYSNRNFFAVDNFSISAGVADDIEPIAITLTNSGTCGSYSNTETVQVLINNNTCRPTSNVPISLQVDGGTTINEVIAGPIDGMSSYLYTFTATADLSAAGTHNIKVTTNLATDGNPANNSLTETRFNSKITVDGTNPYYEDFNAGNNGWVSRINSNTDGTRHFRHDTLPYLEGPEGEGKCWYVETNTHRNYTYFWLESPIFDLSGASDPVLYMDIKYKLYHYYSQFKVDYSTDGGNTWTQLGTSADPNWYEGSTDWWYNNYPDSVADWTTVLHSLCDIVSLSAAEKSCVKFRIFGYAYYGQQGYNSNLVWQTDYSDYNYFAVDNFRIIDKPEVGVTAILEPNGAVSGCLYDKDQNVTIELTNFGCGDLANVPVKCQIDLPPGHPDYASSPLIFSGTVPIATANVATTYTFPATFDMTPMGVYTITAWSEMPGDINTNNDTSTVTISVDFPKITSYPYIEDFNTNDGYWTASGDNPPDNNGRKFVWGTLPYLDGPEGEGKCWYVDASSGTSYNKIWVESPVFDLSEVSNPVLSMDIKYQLYHYYTQFQVQYSTDGGSTWHQLGTSADPNWYVGNTNWWYDNYPDSVADWTHVERDLCGLAGESCVKFRIYGYAYYPNSNRNYFAFDNFRIDAGLSDDVQPVAITLNNSGVCGSFSNTETIQTVINNNLCAVIYDVPVTLTVDGVDIVTDTIHGPIPNQTSYLYTFSTTADLSATGVHTITVTTKLSTDMDNSNDVYTETRINNSPIAISPGNDYYEDFNSGNGGWVSRVNSNTNGSRYFRLDTLPYLNGAEGEGKSWYVETTSHADYMYIWAESPVFDLSASVEPVLRFDIKYQLYHYYSYFRVDYSTNGGTSWTTLGTNSDPNWYQGYTTWWGNNYDNPVDSWTSVYKKLCDVQSETCIKFRVFGYAYYGPPTPGSTLYTGTDYSDHNYFAFDNFEIINGTQDVGVIAILSPDPNDVGCMYSNHESVTVRVYNWSCSDATNVPVVCEITGANNVTLNGTVASIPADSYVDYTFPATFDMTAMGNYHFNAYTNILNDFDPSNDATTMDIFVPYPQAITTYPYLADFNGSTDYWIAGGSDPVLPDIDRGREFVHDSLPYLDGPEGEGESWYVHTTRSGEYYQIWVESPVFDFSSLTEPFLIMDIKYQLYHYYSQFQVQYSTNGGTNWSVLGNSSDLNWYKGTTLWWYNNYPDSVSDWTTVYHNLCDLAGESCVKFRIIGYSYYNDNHNYFAFDNFQIIEGFKDAAVKAYVTPVDNEAPCTFDANKEVTIQVQGSSCQDLNNVPVYCDITGPWGITYHLSGTVNIPANSIVNYTFPTTVDLRSVGTYYFTAYTDLTGDNYPSNDTLEQQVTTLDTLINTFPYYADFNDGKQYWREGTNATNSTRSFVLGQFNYLNGNENNGDAWYVNATTHGSYEFFWVESPVFDLSNLDNPVLSFQVKYQLYHYYTQFHVEYSTNGGQNWYQLGSNADPDWYVGNTNWWYDNLQNAVDQWTYVVHDLCNLKGETCVKFRISGYAYYGITSSGTDYRSRNLFAFDNITITDTDLDVELEAVRGCYGTEYQLEADIVNRNDFCQLFKPCSFDGQGAIQFDNVDDRVELGAFPQLTNFTVEYWLYNPANGVGNYRMSVVAESNRFETVKMNDGTLYFYVPTFGWQNTGRQLPVGKWSHVAITSDGVEVKVYLNGEEIYTRSGNVSIAASNWYLGARSNSTYPTNAALDEVRIWDKALTGNEIRDNICGTLTGSEAGLIAYYQMEDGTGSSTLTDITGNGHTGTLVNMDVNTCWISGTIATDNNGVATDPQTITSIDICYDIDGTVTCNTYPVNIAADQMETVIIPNVLIPNGLSLTNNLCSGGTASASETYPGSSPDNAFDFDINTSGWTNYGHIPCWLQYDFGSGVTHIVNTYRVYCSSTESPGNTNSENYNPATWLFLASNDGSSWDTLDYVYYGNMSMNVWSNFYIDNTTPYRYYRINILAAENSTYTHITELQMYNIDPRPSELTVWIQNPNGLTDEIPINDTIIAHVDEFPHCNDHCVAAIELLNEVTNATSNVNATIDPTEDPDFSQSPCTGVTLENTSWYFFTTNCRGGEVSVTFDSIMCAPGGTGIQVDITRLDALPECDPNNHTEVFCAFPGDESTITWNPTDLLPETRYYITIDGVAGNTCDFKIRLEGNVAFNPIDAMEGTRTIDGTGNFPTIQAAVDSLERYGISAPVVFNTIDVPFNEQIKIATICGADSTNTITFQTTCSDCSGTILQFDADATPDSNYTLKLYRTKYITFKNFDFRALGATNGHAVEISENTNHITFENCKFSGTSTADNSDAFALVYTKDTITNSADITFNNCKFNEGSYGIFMTGKNPTQNINNLLIDNCLFKNQAFSGINLVNIESPAIKNTMIVTNSARTDFSGISLDTCNGKPELAQNQVIANSADGNGLYINQLQATSGNEALIANNMFTIGNSANSYGINIENSQYINLLFNSTNMTSSSGAAFRCNNLDYADIRNNIFASASTNSFDITNLTNSTEDYNNFMPDYASKGANSISINPNYLTASNLHTENAGLQLGDNSTGISIDFDGETRQNPPYIGADEFLGNVIWTGNTDNDWNKITNWNPNTYISPNTNVIIPTSPAGGNFPETNSADDSLAQCKNLTIQNGAHLYVAPNKYLTVWGDFNQYGTFIILSDATGTGSFINKGAINYGAGSTTTMQRYIDYGRWHYVSSPIANADASLFYAPNFYWYDETVADSWNMNNFTGGLMGWTNVTGQMNIMQGYITYQNPDTVEFTGQLNTGTYTYNLSYTDNTATHSNPIFDGWNLVGNPYPSALNWYDNVNISKTNIDGAIYFYLDDGTGAYNNYSYFLPESNVNPYPSIVVNRVSGCIPACQSFFVRANNTGASIQVTDDARIHNHTQFYKSDKPEPPTIRLVATNNTLSDETVIRFIPEATENYDGQLDAIKLVGYSQGVPYLFSIGSDSINLAINSLPIINNVTVVPLGFKTGDSGLYFINVEELNLDDTLKPYLIDKYTDNEVNLRQQTTYKFYSTAGTFRDRFEIILKKDNAPASAQPEHNQDFAQVFSRFMTVYVYLYEKPTEQTTISIYDIAGRKIKEINPTMETTVIPLDKAAEGFYSVVVKDGTSIITKKLLLYRKY